MAKYTRFPDDLIPTSKNKRRYSIKQEDPAGDWDCYVDDVFVDLFVTHDEARNWLNKIAEKLIEGGDTILIIDDF